MERPWDLFNYSSDDTDIMLLDDPVEVSFLIDKAIANKTTSHNPKVDVLSNMKILSSMISKKKITISDFFTHKMTTPTFGAAMAWSGDAITSIHEISQLNPKIDNNYEFVVYPELSYISSDLLVQLVRNSVNDCVMLSLASPEYLNLLSEETHYYSPYITGDSKLLDKSLTIKYLEYLRTVNWLDSLTADNFDKINYEWQKIKYKAIRSQH